MTLAEYLAEVRERVERAKSSNLVPYLRSVVEDNQHMTAIIEEQAKALEELYEHIMRPIAYQEREHADSAYRESQARIDALIVKEQK